MVTCRPSQTRRAAPGRRSSRPRRGISSILVMLFLFLFSALAWGFYMQATVASQVSESERTSQQALLGADSGLKLIRYQLSGLSVPYQTPQQRIEEIYRQLAAQLDGSGNLGGGCVDFDGRQIQIPAGPQTYIPLWRGGPGFRARIKVRSDRSILVKVTGRHNAVHTGPGRAIEAVFREDQIPAPMQAYGVAGRGQVVVSGEGEIRGVPDPAYGTILVTTTTNPAVTMTGPSEISGSIYLTNPFATTSINNSCTVGGVTGAAIPSRIFKVSGTPPEFPVINTDVFKPYLTTTYSAFGGNKLTNCRIPAGSGTAAAPVKLASGAEVNGILFIETPNVVSFEGSCTIRGVIVSQTPYAGDPATNVLRFSGQVTAHDASTLDAAYGDIRNFTGASVICPGFHVQFSGGYASMSGTIASSQLTFTGSAGGTIKGHVFGVGNQVLTVSGKSQVLLEKPATPQWPAGVYFRSKYVPQAESYMEVTPEEPAEVAVPPPTTSPV